MVVKRAKSALCYDSRFYGRIESAQKSKKNARNKVESPGPLLPLPRRLRERTWKRSCHHHVKSPGKKYLWRADSKRFGFVGRFTGYVWTEAVCGKKKVRIQKYLDTCGLDSPKGDVTGLP